MPIFRCNGCSYETDHKTSIHNHINRINKCNELLSEIENERYQIIKKISKSRKDIKDILQNKTCDKCDKILYDSSSKKRHSEICKGKSQVPLTQISSQLSQIQDDQGYIYLLAIYPYHENILKVGKTLNYQTRFSGYKNTRPIIHFSTSCKNYSKCEKDILKIFKDTFTQRIDIGVEYYQGSVDEMKKILHKYFL